MASVHAVSTLLLTICTIYANDNDLINCSLILQIGPGQSCLACISYYSVHAVTSSIYIPDCIPFTSPGSSPDFFI